MRSIFKKLKGDLSWQEEKEERKVEKVVSLSN